MSEIGDVKTEIAEIAEKSPQYKQKMQWVGIAVVALLSISLALSSYLRRSGDKLDRPEPIVEQVNANDDEEEKSFDARLEEGIEKKRSTRRISEDGDYRNDVESVADPNNKYNQYQEDRPRKTGFISSGETGKDSDGMTPEKAGYTQTSGVEKEFKMEERKRALAARKVAFGLKPCGEDGGFEQPKDEGGLFIKDKDGLSLSEGNIGGELSALELEKKQVSAEIKRVEDKLNDPKLLSKLEQQEDKRTLGLSDVSPIDKISRDTAQKNGIVGSPAAESEQKEGQVLVMTGTVISGVLDQQLMSDYVGPFRGLVTHDVYDAAGNYIVIPKGSRITGRSLKIGNVNEPIQARMGLTVRWIVLPNGNRISFEKKSAALDQAGVPAIKDQVDYHLLAQFLGVTAYALVANEGSYEGTGANSDESFEGNFSESMRKQFSSLASKYLELVPTITLRSGTPLKVFLEDDLYAYPWEDIGQKFYRANRSVD
jgi:type IV secretory pathway VirB10-like protein